MARDGRARRDAEKAVVVLDAVTVAEYPHGSLGPLYYGFERGSLLRLKGIASETASVLAQTIAGLRQPLSGSVTLYGALAHSDEGRSIATYIAPSIRLLPGLTINENAELWGCCSASGERTNGLPSELAGLVQSSEWSPRALVGELASPVAVRASQVVLLASSARVLCLDGSLEFFDGADQAILGGYLSGRVQTGTTVLVSSSSDAGLGLSAKEVTVAAVSEQPVRERRRRG